MSNRRLCAVAVLAAAALYTPNALGATPGELHLVFFQQDTSVQAQMDQMFGCLCSSSTFGSTWCQQFGLSQITYAGSVVLTQQAPDPLVLGGNLDDLMVTAMDNGLVPQPKQGIANEYVVYVPAGVTMQDSQGGGICDGSGTCAEHGFSDYHGLQYDLAMVPISCNECGPGLDAASIGGEHEAAEGLADQGTAMYEVGDGCESQQNTTQLQCCGNQYDLQQLAGMGGENDCQTIMATGSMCGCSAANVACATTTDCCSGLTCDPMSHVCTNPPPPDAGSDGGSSSGSSSSGSSGGSSGSGSSSGSGGGNSSSGGSDVDGGAKHTDGGGEDDGGGNFDAPNSRTGCGCQTVGATPNVTGGGILASLGAMAMLARVLGRRKRRGAP